MKKYLFVWIVILFLPISYAQLPGECNYFCGCHQTEWFALSNINLHFVLTADTSFYQPTDTVALCFSAKNWGIFPIDLLFPVAREITFSIWQDSQIVWSNIPTPEPPDTHIVRLTTFGSQVKYFDFVAASLFAPGEYEIRAWLTSNQSDTLVLPIEIGGHLTAVSYENNQPSEFVLNQNFPNPFNSQTNISFYLPQGGNIKLSVWDLLGREVEVLQESYLPVGWQQAVFLATDLTSGFYIYRLQTAQGVLSKKMLYVK